jgi:hypothetical protein
MGWSCKECGIETADTAALCSGGCGYVNMAKRCILSCETQRMKMMVATEIGARSLIRLCGEGLRGVASTPQFRIVPRRLSGGWVLEHCSTAANATFLNGVVASSEGNVLLETGDIITIAGSAREITIELGD